VLVLLVAVLYCIYMWYSLPNRSYAE
jgi:hypothetical protein